MADRDLAIDDASERNSGRDNDHTDYQGSVSGHELGSVIDDDYNRPGDEESQDGRYTSGMEIRLGIPGPRDLAEFDVVFVAGRRAPKTGGWRGAWFGAGMTLTVLAEMLIILNIDFSSPLADVRRVWMMISMVWLILLAPGLLLDDGFRRKKWRLDGILGRFDVRSWYFGASLRSGLPQRICTSRGRRIQRLR
jgi:hypothetical protein